MSSAYIFTLKVPAGVFVGIVKVPLYSPSNVSPLIRDNPPPATFPTALTS